MQHCASYCSGDMSLVTSLSLNAQPVRPCLFLAVLLTDISSHQCHLVGPAPPTLHGEQEEDAVRRAATKNPQQRVTIAKRTNEHAGISTSDTLCSKTFLGCTASPTAADSGSHSAAARAAFFLF